MRYGGHAFGFRRPDPQGRDAEFQRFYDHREEVLPWIKEYSPYEHAGPGDPPVFLDYPSQDKPARLGEEQKDPTHSAVMGVTLQEKLRENGDEAHLAYPGHEDPEYAEHRRFPHRQAQGQEAVRPSQRAGRGGCPGSEHPPPRSRRIPVGPAQLSPGRRTASLWP